MINKTDKKVKAVKILIKNNLKNENKIKNILKLCES